VNWNKHIWGFPQPLTYGQEYNAWLKALKRKMEQDRIPGCKQSTAAQWAAIQPYAITLQPVSQRSGLWQVNNLCGECVTKCLDVLLTDIAKNPQRILTDRLKVQPIATVAVVDPAPARNDRKVAPSVCPNVPIIRLQLLQVSLVGALCLSVWIKHPKSGQAAHFLPGWTESSGKLTNMFTGWS